MSLLHFFWMRKGKFSCLRAFHKSIWGVVCMCCKLTFDTLSWILKEKLDGSKTHLFCAFFLTEGFEVLSVYVASWSLTDYKTHCLGFWTMKEKWDGSGKKHYLCTFSDRGRVNVHVFELFIKASGVLSLCIANWSLKVYKMHCLGYDRKVGLRVKHASFAFFLWLTRARL